jgi:DNA-binding CsgD family transcriptional regulator
MRVRFDRLGLASAAAQDQLRKALFDACNFPHRASAFSVGAMPSGQRLQVRVVPAPDEQPLGVVGERLALTFLSQGSAPRDAQHLQQMFDLTSAEAELVKLLAQGMSLQACADARAVSISTARAQLSAVFSKTGTSSQAQLLSVVLAMPAFR